MKKALRVQRGIIATIAACAVGLGVLTAFSAPGDTSAPPGENAGGESNYRESKYIGAAKCKSCHQGEEKGDQYGIWAKGPHAKAFETLGTDAAKAVAKERGIEDPQKAGECLKCHTTAYGVDAKLIKKGFKIEAGVQCETCHGPGDDHLKARFKAAATEDPNAKPEPGEIIVDVPQAKCLECHNEESPSFKPFCFYKRAAEISHRRPDSTRPAMLVCGCDPCSCVHGSPDGCGVEKK